MSSSGWFCEPSVSLADLCFGSWPFCLRTANVLALVSVYSFRGLDMSNLACNNWIAG